jgi:RHS repeat-associated protein
VTQTSKKSFKTGIYPLFSLKMRHFGYKSPRNRVKNPPAVVFHRGNFCPKKYAGKERDYETGLYYYGARYLDSKTSRWLSGDPAMGKYVPKAGKGSGGLPGMGGVYNTVNLHAYHYAGNNPVKYVDPDGKQMDNSQSKFNQKITSEIDNGFKGGIGGGGGGSIALPSVTSGIKALLRIIADGALWAVGKKIDNATAESAAASPEQANINSGENVGQNLTDRAQASTPSQLPQNDNDDKNNPYKGKTPEEIDKDFRSKGYTPKGEDPVSGKGSYIDESTGTKYYLDKGGTYRVPGRGVVNEPPHVDVEVPNLPKARFEL